MDHFEAASYLERVHNQWPGCGFVVTCPLTTKY